MEGEQGQSLVYLLQKPRHTRDKCWKLNGKPPSHEWGTRGGQSRPQTYMTDPPRPQAHMVEQPKNEEKIAVAVGEFSSEDIERLKNLLGSLEKPSGPGLGRKIGLAKERSGLYYLEPSLDC
ncbi:hypothetical protein HPP92_025430 [Vanilla planifolia]|uniref:Uncharacterized protein n=1 Tax=Vanilla planifolia TaxID=51239 RepID=A0A835PFD4_VANPL|nr:hypothetical protein HPP92_025430 [Vanilla planifolia]